MRIPHLALLLSCLALVLAPARIRAADPAPEAGFTLLFNGKNLDGWRTAKTSAAETLDGKTETPGGRMKVKDGTLVYDPSVKGQFYIETAKQFGKDVEIKLDFKAGPKCNNDFFLRGTKFDIVLGGKETKDVKEGEWSTLEISVKGDSVEHKINGQTIRTSKATAASSPFMLRAEIGDIEIKNIRVKE